jgi:phytoene dehydrogenase-like protein
MRLALDGPLEFRGREKDPIVRARIGADLDELERAFDPAKYDEFPETPSLDVYVPSLEDASLAPPGHHVVTIHSRCVPYRHAAGWLPDGRIEAEQRIWAALPPCAGAEARIVGAEFLPPWISKPYGLVRASTMGTMRWTSSGRPTGAYSRPRSAGALWGGVHPGTTVDALSDRSIQRMTYDAIVIVRIRSVPPFPSSRPGPRSSCSSGEIGFLGRTRIGCPRAPWS